MYNFPVVRLANILTDFKHKLSLIEPCHGMNHVRLFRDFVQNTERDDILCHFTRAFHDNPNVDVMAWYKKIGSGGKFIDLPEPIFDRLSHQYMLIFYASQPDRVDLRNFSAIHFRGAHLEEKLWRLKKLTVFPFVYGMQHACDRICEALPESGNAPLMQLFYDSLPSVDKFLVKWAREEELAEQGEGENDEEPAAANDLLDLVSAVSKGEDPSSQELEAPLQETAPAPSNEPPLREEAPLSEPDEPAPTYTRAATETLPAAPSAPPRDQTLRAPAASQPLPRSFARQAAPVKEQLAALWQVIGDGHFDAKTRHDLRVDLEILALELARGKTRADRAQGILDDIGRAFVPDPLRALMGLVQG